MRSMMLRNHLSSGLASMAVAAAGALAAVAGVASVPNVAHAQQSAQSPGLALDRFDPAPAGDRMFGVPSPYAAGDLTPHVMLLGDYAHNPLVLRTIPSNQSDGAIVQSQLYLHLDAGLALWSRLFVDVNIPLAVYQHGGNEVAPAAGLYASPSSVQFGDLRFGARVRLFGEYHDPFQIAVGGFLWVPTGAKDAFVSTGEVRGLPELILGGRVAERLVWSAAAGPHIERSSTFAGTEQGSMFKFGAGAGVLLLDDRHLQLGAEIDGDLTLRDVQKRTTNAELLFHVRYRVIDDLEIGAGAGPGLTTGIGTPDARGLLMVAYTPEQKLDRDGDGIPDNLDACPDVKGVHTDDPRTNGCPPDRDGDGILDVEDACPDVKGVRTDDPRTNGCPPDRDGDGILDAEDACPDVKGIRTNDPKTNGCPPPPPDRDGDGIPDAEDACPDVKGVRTSDPKTNGCPPDRDGDGIPDPVDACPDVPGQPDRDPAKNGCPHRAVFTEKEIIILEQVQFDTGKSTIKRVSDALLDEVGAVLKDHPEILKLEVQGHTDSRGAKAANKILSQQRADAVLKALVARGIDRSRMTPKGYGQDKPIADNNTDEGRQKNRRVQFVITDKKMKAAQ